MMAEGDINGFMNTGLSTYETHLGIRSKDGEIGTREAPRVREEA